MRSEATPTLAAFTARVLRRSDRRQALAALDHLGWRQIMTLWEALFPFLLRAAFFSIVQLLEMLLLMHLHFFFVPPGSMHVLAVMSVLHTAALSVALSLKRSAAHPFEKRSLAIARLNYALKTSIACFAAAALVLGAVVIFATDIHFTSPPLYRAMLMSWIAGLPLEAGIIMGLYTLGRRRQALLGRRLTFFQIAHVSLGLSCIALDLPLFYVLSHILTLVGGFACVLPGRISRRVKAGQLVSLLSQSLPPALIELGGKLLYLPLVYLEPSCAIVLLVMQRLMHICSAMSMRTADIVSISVTRRLLLDDQGPQARVLRRLCLLLAAGLVLAALIGLPFITLRFSPLLWGSLHTEPLHVSWLWVSLLLGCCLLRAALIGLMRLASEVKNSGSDNQLVFSSATAGRVDIDRPSLYAAALVCAVSAASFLVLHYLLVGCSLLEVFLCFMTIDLLLLAGLCVQLRHRLTHPPRVLWRARGLPALLAANHRHVLCCEVAAGLTPALDGLKEELAVAADALCYLQWNSRQLLLACDKLPDVLIEQSAFFHNISWSREVDECMPRHFRAGLFAAAYTNDLQNPLQSYRGALLPETLYAAAGDADALEDAVSRLPGVSCIAISEIFSSQQHPRRIDLLRYLDMIVRRGPVTLLRGHDKATRGMLHCNAGRQPAFMLLIDRETRRMMPELAYVTFLHNMRDAGLCGNQEASWNQHHVTAHGAPYRGVF